MYENDPLPKSLLEASARVLLKTEMTSAQKDKREEIVKSMKSKEAEFKSKYGDRWKDVMYATATKQAMNKSLDESADSAIKSAKSDISSAIGVLEKNMGRGSPKLAALKKAFEALG